MKKNINIEIIRAIAVLYVVIYHIQVILGKSTSINSIKTIIGYGGEIGVTLFFIISGYGIYKSIDLKNKKKEFNYLKFMKKRFLKLSPAYYLCLLICLTITGAASYLGKDGIADILTHLTYTQNLFVSTHGSINGVLWTMGTFMQFYLVAPLLYRVIKKNRYVGLTISIIITIISKIIIYNIISKNGFEPTYYFVYGRQVLTALDNFVLGMFLATLDEKKASKILTSFGLIIALISIFVLLNITNKYGVYNNSIFGYIWHSLLAILLFMGILCFNNVRINENNLINKIILLIGRNEYEIYLYHWIIINNIINTGIINYARNISTMLTGIILLITAVIFGIIMAQFKFNFKSKKV